MTERSTIGLGLAVLAVCAAIAPVVPASGEIVRNPSAAAPRVADVGGSAGGPGGPRDGSAAVPFVAEVGPDKESGGEGFDWADVALGAIGGGMLVVLGSTAARRLGRRSARPRITGSAAGA
jgi:hypothetical protein